MSKKKYMYSKILTCPLCHKTRTILDDRKINTNYPKNEALCKPCSMITFRRKKRLIKIKDEILASGSIYHYSERDALTKTPHMVPITCGICKKKRLHRVSKNRRGKPVTGYCASCAKKALNLNGPNSHFWRGGRYNIDGYIILNYYAIPKKHLEFLKPMIGKNGRISEHRMIKALELGRILRSDEHVHHLNGIRTDNRQCNLVITSPKEHPAENRTMTQKLYNEIKRLQDLLTNNTITF